MSQPRLCWFDWLMGAALMALVALSLSGVEPHACDTPPCETGSGGECGCEPVNPPCSMPCRGCCPGGCKAVDPLPGRQ